MVVYIFGHGNSIKLILHSVLITHFLWKVYRLQKDLITTHHFSYETFKFSGNGSDHYTTEFDDSINYSL